MIKSIRLNAVFILGEVLGMIYDEITLLRINRSASITVRVKVYVIERGGISMQILH